MAALLRDVRLPMRSECHQRTLRVRSWSDAMRRRSPLSRDPTNDVVSVRGGSGRRRSPLQRPVNGGRKSGSDDGDFGQAPTLEERLRHSERRCCLPQREMSQRANLLIGHPSLGRRRRSPCRLRSRNPQSNPLRNSCPLELRNRAQDVKLETTSSGAGVDALSYSFANDF